MVTVFSFNTFLPSPHGHLTFIIRKQIYLVEEKDKPTSVSAQATRGLSSPSMSSSGTVTIKPVVFEGMVTPQGATCFSPAGGSSKVNLFRGTQQNSESFNFPSRSPWQSTKRSMPTSLCGWAHPNCHLKHTVSPKQRTVPNSIAACHGKGHFLHFPFPAPPVQKTFEIING